MDQFYCVPCGRPFSSQTALQMHLENARIHRSEVTRHTRREQPRNVTASILPLPRLVPPPTRPVAQTVHLGSPLLNPDSNVNRTSTAIGTGPSPHSQHSMGSQLQPKSLEQVLAGIAIHLPSPSNFTTSLPADLDPLLSTNSVRAKFKHGNNYWSEIPDYQRASTLDKLSRQCHSSDDLRKNKYTLTPWNARTIFALRRCTNCHGVQGKIEKRTRIGCRFHPGEQQSGPTNAGRGPFSCCGRAGTGCTFLPTHRYGAVDPQLAARYESLAPSPSPSPQLAKRQAVALDSEMAGVRDGSSALILVCAVDFLTGETLVNALVQPTERVVDWSTRYSGVTPKAMAIAKAQGETLKGWRAARAALWEYIDANTILVGASLQNDLDVLRMLHNRVVDTAILTRNAVGLKCARQWGLKTLCRELLGMEIQVGKKGHDCMEDTLATREVVLWCIENLQDLRSWALVKAEEERARESERLEIARMKEAALEARKKSEEEKSRQDSLGTGMSNRNSTGGEDSNILPMGTRMKCCGGQTLPRITGGHILTRGTILGQTE